MLNIPDKGSFMNLNMRKRTTLLSALLIIMLLSCCASSFPKKETVAAMTDQQASEVLKGKTEKEICENWGTPDDRLSGFYGDIYNCDNKQIIIYFDADGKVSDVHVIDKQN